MSENGEMERQRRGGKQEDEKSKIGGVQMMGKVKKMSKGGQLCELAR
jgi:hypothetical protein